MSVWESVRIALDMLRLHKLRAFLTMLGVIIGVMSVTMIVLLSEGFKTFIAGEFSKQSPDTVFIFFDPSRAPHGEHGRFEAIKEEDRQYLVERVPEIGTIAGLYFGPSQTVRAGSAESKDTQVTAFDERYNDIAVQDLLEGRLINKDDVDNLANVAVVSDELANQLFPGGKALGRNVVLNGITLEVVGITRYEKSALSFGGNQSRTLQLPVTTAQRKWLGGRSYSMLLMRPKAGVTVEKLMDSVWQALMARTHNVPLYRIDSNEGILKVFQNVIGVAGMVLACVAALSLLVGGIGIMNIMLVSVTERTREIGLRKAVGGKRAAILTQFLVEAAMLSLVGGLIGMGLAWSLGQLVSTVSVHFKIPNEHGLHAPFPLTSAMGAAAFSAMIGMVFGFFPAVSAAQLDPIDALRHE